MDYNNRYKNGWGNYYPISKEQAEEIASEDYNLINDYNKRTNNKMYISIYETDTRLVSKEGKVYWLVQVLNARTSGCERSSFFDRLFYGADWDEVDGEINDKKDLKLLRCLIDANTGEYTYFPQKFWEKWEY